MARVFWVERDYFFAIHLGVNLAETLLDTGTFEAGDRGERFLARGNARTEAVHFQINSVLFILFKCKSPTLKSSEISCRGSAGAEAKKP